MTLGSAKGKPVPSSRGCPVELWKMLSVLAFISALRKRGEVGCSSSQRTIVEDQAGASQAMHSVHPASAASWGSMQEVEQTWILPDWDKISTLDEAFRRWWGGQEWSWGVKCDAEPHSSSRHLSSARCYGVAGIFPPDFVVTGYCWNCHLAEEPLQGPESWKVTPQGTPGTHKAVKSMLPQIGR